MKTTTRANREKVRANRLTLFLLVLLLAIMNLGCSGLVAADPPSNGHPSIVTQPTNQLVTVGQRATFTVAATGRGPLSYQWHKNGTPISGAGSQSYTTSATASSDNGAQFTVVISNTVGSVTSGVATLTVNAASVAPSITAQPASQTVTTGQTAFFSVAATGSAPLSYQWNRNGTAISGATSSSYTTPATGTTDNGAQFTVLVSNAAGTATSSVAILTVNAAPVAPSITSQPISQTVMEGQAASFNVTATGTAPLNYQWQKSGSPILGATSPTYATPAAATSDNGAQFTVIVSNAVGSVTSSVATLTVNAASVAPSITAQPTNQTVTVGQTASFSVTATGTAPLSYQWQKGGSPILGATSPTYTTPATTNSDNAAQFTVLVRNTVGSVTSSVATLTVNAAPVAPSITAQPTNQTVAVGQTASFSVTATGTAPLSYQWQKFGSPILGATSPSYTTPAAASSDNGAQFTVIVSNAVGNVTSSVATLTVNAAPAPAIQVTPNPVNFANAVVGLSSSRALVVTNTGTATLSITQVTETGSPFFTVNGFSLPLTVGAGQQTTITATYLPISAGTVSGSISITSNTPGSPLAIPMSGSAAASTFLLGANPTSLSFGNVNVGSNSSMSTVLTNSGNSTVTISGVTSSVAGFSPSGVAAGMSLTPGQTATLNVAFAPVAVGSVTGTITVNSNATNSPTTISLAGSGVQQTSSAFPAWVSPGLIRVGKADAPGTTSSISLLGARGETVDTQVIVQAPVGGLSNVNLSSSALTGPGGATIPASNVTLYREYYITVTGTGSYGGGSNPPLGSGTYPEPLIPFNDPETGSPLCATSATLKACNAAIPAGQNQPYWVDISVPRGATNSPPGTYTGTISITATQGNVTIPVTLTVWNFELPAQPSELSEWTLWNPATGNTTTTLDQALMRNKVMGRFDVAASASSDTANFGLNRSGLDGYYFIGIQCNGSYSSLPSASQIDAAAANFPASLPLDFYVADELNGCSGAYAALKTMGTNAHTANPSVKTLMTTNAPDANLFNEGDGRSAIDHWVLLDAMQQWPALPYAGGGDLWSYASCNTGFGNTPAWMVDYPPINERIQAGFLNWTQGATGLLYWRADGWTNGNTIASWDNVDTTGCGGGMGRPGDGIFIYPPGPIASSESAPGIRLKAIRDGLQDYEYAQILKNLSQFAFLNPILQPIATSWTNWSKDPNALEAARLQLGQQLHLLAP